MELLILLGKWVFAIPQILITFIILNLITNHLLQDLFWTRLIHPLFAIFLAFIIGIALFVNYRVSRKNFDKITFSNVFFGDRDKPIIYVLNISGLIFTISIFILNITLYCVKTTDPLPFREHVTANYQEPERINNSYLNYAGFSSFWDLFTRNEGSNVNFKSPEDTLIIFCQLVPDFSTHKSYSTVDSLIIFPDYDKVQIMRTYLEHQPREIKTSEINSMIKARYYSLGEGKLVSKLYLSTKTNFAQLTNDHFDILSNVFITDIKDLENFDDDGDLYLYWMNKYVGQWCPRIRIIIDNTNGYKNFTIYSLVYEVKQFADLKPRKGSSRKKIFFQKLSSRVGTHTWSLSNNKHIQPIEVKRNSTQSIDIVFGPDESCPTLGEWIGDLKLYTSIGPLYAGYLKLNTYDPTYCIICN